MSLPGNFHDKSNFELAVLVGTPLYNIAKEEGLLLTNKRELHYLSAANDKQFILNMKEQSELLTQEEYNEICMEMLAFQQANNRLSYGDEPGSATVEDKSFSFVELASDAETAAPAPPPLPPPAAASLLDGVKNLFRS